MEKIERDRVDKREEHGIISVSAPRPLSGRGGSKPGRKTRTGGAVLASTRKQGEGRARRPSTGVRVSAVIGKTIGTVLLILVITAVLLTCFAAAYIKNVIMPQAHLEANFDMDLTSTIYYQDPDTGEYVEHLALHGTENRVLVKYENIPEHLVNATVAIEDETFWTHSGVNWKRTLYGVFLMFSGGDIQGGSTITQQLIKNSTGYDDVTVKRKILEIFTALDFDKTYSKTQIMEWYLNYIYLGEGCNGVATAARNYFNKDVSQLSLAECASLISITNNPSRYNPYRYLENNQVRARLVLGKMLELGSIDQSEYDTAMAEVDDLASHLARGVNEEKPTTIYNWYDEQLLTDVISDLKEQYGYSDTLANDMVTSGGLKIYACVDPDIQEIVEEIYSDQGNMPLVSASGQQLQSAIVIIDQQGNIVGLAGALGEKTTNRGWNYASRSTRQPGSSIKTLSVYAPALDMGLITPASVLDDYPTQLLNNAAWPSNSYGYYKGLTDVRWAVALSSNPVAVRVLEQVTPEVSYDMLENHFHISTLESGATINGQYKDDYGASQLALGGMTYGVKVTEMAAAYSVFSRDGMYVEPRTYTKVTMERDGQEIVLLDNTTREMEAVVKETTAWYVNDMLKEVVESGTGTDANFSGMEIAGKTGSTTSNNDRWFVGYTPYYTAAVWCGYEYPERISAGGQNPSAVLWRMVMSRVHEGLEYKDFNQPSGLTTVRYCKDSGMLPTEACAQDPRGSRVATAQVFQGQGPVESCTMHVEVEVCDQSPIKKNESAVEGLFHKVGEFCPREPVEALGIESSVKSVTALDFTRERVGTAAARDDDYLLSFLEEQGECDVHTEEIVVPPAPYDPESFDISDPTTWPPIDDERYLDFDPENPATWPGADTVTPPEMPGEGDLPPVSTQEPQPTHTPTPEPTPSYGEEQHTPADEP